MSLSNSPFLLENETAYLQWRDKKMHHYPTNLGDILVELNDPRKLTETEHQTLLQHCQKTNMVIYAGNTGDDPDPKIPLTIGQAFKVSRLDHNWLADESGLTSLTVVDEGARQNYIPYSNKAINCVVPAPAGGENRSMDHEVAYIELRDTNPAYISTLMAEDVMTIPARLDKDGNIARKEETGPVFSVNPQTGDLHMRYTIRSRNVVWKDDPLTQEAVQYLEQLLESDSPYIYQGKLESGMGLISNNILHDRSAFEDNDKQKRLLYRARYYDRLAGTSISDIYR